MKYLLLFLVSLPSFAGDFSSLGQVTFESRVFEDDGINSTVDENYGIASRLEGTYSHDDFWEERFRIFSRNDRKDDSRNILLIEELYVAYIKEKWSLKLGWQILNWSATEAFHPADIINSRNLDSNVENPEKYGELMANFSYLFEESTLNVYLMPYLQKSNFPAASNRLSFKLTRAFPDNGEVWVGRDGYLKGDRWELQGAFKYDFTAFDGDYSLYAAAMHDRQVFGNLIYLDSGLNPTGFSIVYMPMTQYGFTYQQVFGPWVVKLETAYKDFLNPDPKFTVNNISTYQIEDHGIIAFGFEYGFGHDDGKDSTFILEGQMIEGVTKAQRAAYSLFQKDLLLGYRLAFNDVKSKEFFVSLIWDMERTKEYLFSASYGQRLTDVWGLKTGLRVVYAPQEGQNPVNLENLDKANQVYLNLTRYF